MLHNFKGVRTRLWGATSKNTWQKPLSQWRIHQVLQLFCSSWNAVSIATSLYFNEEVKTADQTRMYDSQSVVLVIYHLNGNGEEKNHNQRDWFPDNLFPNNLSLRQIQSEKKKRGRVCLSARDTFHTIYIISSLTCMADHFWLSGLVIFIFPELFTNEDDLQCLKAIGIFNQLIWTHNGFFCENITKVMNKWYKWTPLALSLCIEEERA